ncbi:hypothetical protein GGR58DRAFT_520143 [Xylaria digitata]|nr:hypothetical protein GGR58DRAFT_520143 [Xylaria digitata]
MYNAKVLLSMAALVGSSLAQTPTGLDPTCLESLAVFNNAPTPGPALISYLASVVTGRPTLPGQTTPLPDVTLEDPAGYQEFFCGLVAELPESLLPEFKSYGAGLISYGSAHLSEYDAYITDCVTTGEAAASLTSQLHDMLTGTGGLCQAKPTTTPDASSSGTYPTGTPSFAFIICAQSIYICLLN